MSVLSILLHALGPHLLFSRGNDPFLSETCGIYLAEPDADLEPGMIYVGTSQDIAALLTRNPDLPGCLVFSAGKGSLSEQFSPSQGMLLAVDLSFIPLYNTLARALCQSRSWIYSVESSADGSLNGLLSAASSILGFSGIFLDLNGNSLAQSIRREEKDFLSRDPASLPSGASVQDRLIPYLFAQNELPLASLREEDCRCLMTTVHSAAEPLGYLLLCTRENPPELEAMALTLSHILSRHLSRQRLSLEADSFQSIAVQFLGESPEDLDALQKRLERLPGKRERFMQGIVIRQLENGSSPAETTRRLEQLFQELRRAYPREKLALLDHYVFLLTGSSHPEIPAVISEDPRFEEILERHDAFAMASNPSQWLRNLRLFSRQALQILPVAAAVRFQEEEKRHCLKFQRYALYYIIHLCEIAMQSESRTNDILYLCDTGVLTLTRYDQSFNSNLRDTLFIYLTNNCSISETSRRMYVHRNTVIYKLNLIRSLIGDKLDNSSLRTHLILSCIIIRYLERYRRQTLDLPPFEKGLLRPHE